MRHLVFSLVVCFVLGVAARAEDVKLPELKVPVSKAAAPKIDGVLDDAIWKDAPSASEFKLKEDGKPTSKTKMLVTRDEKVLYIAVECFESAEALKALKADVTQNDSDEIWADDSVEIFIDPTGKRESYYQLIVNSKGSIWDAFHAFPRSPDSSWNSESKVAAKVGTDNWTCELAIPLTAFNKSGASAAEWAFNVARNRSASQETVFWSPVFNDSSHVPEKFGKLSGMPVIAPKPPEPAKAADAPKATDPAAKPADAAKVEEKK